MKISAFEDHLPAGAYSIFDQVLYIVLHLLRAPCQKEQLRINVMAEHVVVLLTYAVRDGDQGLRQSLKFRHEFIQLINYSEHFLPSLPTTIVVLQEVCPQEP